jgi:hypothetical protein
MIDVAGIGLAPVQHRRLPALYPCTKAKLADSEWSTPEAARLLLRTIDRERRRYCFADEGFIQ